MRRSLHRQGRVAAVCGAAAIGLLLAGCSVVGGEKCEHTAADTYQDHLITYDVAADVTEVEATVRIGDLGTTIRMTGDCRLEFDGKGLSATNRGIGETYYVGKFDGYHGDGIVSFTDIDGVTVENSIEVDPSSFTLIVPTSPPATGFAVTIGAPPMADAYVKVRVEDGASHRTVVHGWVSEPIEVRPVDVLPATAGDEVVIHVVFGFGRAISDPPDGSGEIEYRQRFEPVRVTLA